VSRDLDIQPGDPHEARTLLEASHAMMMDMFTPDSNHFLSIEELAGPDIAFFVARRNGIVVGCGAVATRPGYCELKSMFVSEDARGTGVATALMDRLEAETLAQGHDLMRLETGNLLHAAQALYRRRGFALCGPFGEYSEHPHSVFMEKRLS